MSVLIVSACKEYACISYELPAVIESEDGLG
jgi:hypothetical protein